MLLQYRSKIKTIVMVFTLFASLSALADNGTTVVYFNEKEEGIDPYQVRYIFGENLIRIDDNVDEGDFVLYDDRSRTIYSISHEDKTVLVLKYSDWSLPKFSYERNETWKELEDAPSVANKKVHTYWLSAGEEICAQAQVADGFLEHQAKLLSRYRETLSADQIKSIVATPEEMRTPCMMIDQVYNTGGMYHRGLAIHEWHSNGLQRIMTGFEENKTVAGTLFKLPADYKHYSMGDSLEFGGTGLDGINSTGNEM